MFVQVIIETSDDMTVKDLHEGICQAAHEGNADLLSQGHVIDVAIVGRFEFDKDTQTIVPVS